MKNIFVGNLNFGATESAVRSLFEAYGTVERVNLITDRDTGRSRGFGFVEMTSAEDGEKAIAALNGLQGRPKQPNVPQNQRVPLEWLEQFRAVELFQRGIESDRRLGGEPFQGIAGIGLRPRHVIEQRHLVQSPKVELVGQRIAGKLS